MGEIVVMLKRGQWGNLRGLSSGVILIVLQRMNLRGARIAREGLMGRQFVVWMREDGGRGVLGGEKWCKDSWEIELVGIGDWLGKQEQVRRVRFGQFWRFVKRKKIIIFFLIKFKFNFCYFGFLIGFLNLIYMIVQFEVLGWYCIDF